MIKIAKSAGYCFGVDNAIKTVIHTAQKHSGTPIYTLGPLIHNAYVVDTLHKMNIVAVDDIKNIREGIVAIRSHGVGKKIYEDIVNAGLTYLDATCPYVKSIQNKVEKYSERGYTIVIVGDCEHPEVIGVNGWCNNQAIIVKSPKKAMEIKANLICVVQKTTIIK